MADKGERVLVCGGRDFSDHEQMRGVLWALEPGLIIEGGARGADRLAREWANAQGVPVLTFNANWTDFGRGAGPARNQQMLDEGKPDVVVAFRGGRGTADMVERARKAGVPVIEVLS